MGKCVGWCMKMRKNDFFSFLSKNLWGIVGDCGGKLLLLHPRLYN